MRNDKLLQSIPFSQQNLRSQLPDIPSDQWCDFRTEYENGLTLKEIAEKYYCDPRTVKHCLFTNRGSGELGRQSAPTKAEAYLGRIEQLYCDHLRFKNDTAVHSSEGGSISGICGISRRITEQIRKEGYAGSERTVRNYIRSRFYVLKRNDEG